MIRDSRDDRREAAGGGPSPPTLEAKVAFLSDPAAYPGEGGPVTVRETHMSWVFLTPVHAYKMKKPMRKERLDFSTLERRRRMCAEEIRLNRRLAPDVYLAVLPLTAGDGSLAVGGDGVAVEWLVRMRRLPAAGTLEAMAAAGTLTPDAVAGVVRLLAPFYAAAPSEPVSPAAYRQWFRARVAAARRELLRPDRSVPADMVHRACDRLGRFIDVEGARLDERARQGRIVEGHGDLRPEHVYLSPRTLVIDCLEFDRELRLADPADELAYLAMECDDIGATSVHRWLFDAWAEASGDRPAADLIDFHKACRALHRAKMALWHIERPGRRDAAHWRGRARDYLELAAGCSDRLP